MWRKLPVLVMAIVGAATFGGALHAETLSPDAINGATLAAKAQDGVNPAIIKAQVLLDRAGFSPGVIDGHGGDNTDLALSAFEQANGLDPSGKLDQATWDKLTATPGGPVAKTYAIAKDDVDGPFTKHIPAKFEELADLDHLGYRGPKELLAEKFHMDQDLLERLNPGKDFDKAGTQITVAAVNDDRGAQDKGKVDKVEVDKAKSEVRAYDHDGKLLATYPATIGSDERPSPSGTHKVKAIAKNPTYTYTPDLNFKGVKAKKPFTIAPGPNNPVGLVWIDLDAPGYGIHGTPEPAKIGKTASHGCVRLTNWDALELAAMVHKGTEVVFLGEPETAHK